MSDVRGKHEEQETVQDMLTRATLQSACCTSIETGIVILRRNYD